MQAARHKRIFGLQSRILGIIAGVLIGVTGLFGGIQTVQNHQQAAVVEQATENASFWRIIADTEAPQSSDPATRLAIDLRNALNDPANPATGLPDAITEFRVSPNDYGRVDQALGFDPFESQECNACGQLNEFTLNQLRLIKSGNIDQVIAAEATAAPVGGIEITPFGLPIIAWAGFVYLTATTGALMLAVRRDSKLNQYLVSELNWKDTGGSVADQYKRMSLRISPAYRLVLIARGKLGKDYDDHLTATNLIQQHRTIKEMMKLSKDLPAGEREETQRKLNQLLQQIDEQVANHAEHDRDFHEDEAVVVRRRIQDAVDTITGNLELRRVSFEELENPAGVDLEALGLSMDEKEQSSNPENGRTQPGN